MCCTGSGLKDFIVEVWSGGFSVRFAECYFTRSILCTFAYSWLLAHNRRAGRALEAMESKKLDPTILLMDFMPSTEEIVGLWLAMGHWVLPKRTMSENVWQRV